VACASTVQCVIKAPQWRCLNRFFRHHGHCWYIIWKKILATNTHSFLGHHSMASNRKRPACYGLHEVSNSFLLVLVCHSIPDCVIKGIVDSLMSMRGNKSTQKKEIHTPDGVAMRERESHKMGNKNHRTRRRDRRKDPRSCVGCTSVRNRHCVRVPS
jgi:hypothetical protein